VVTLQRGAPDMAASLWIGDLGGEAVQSADGHSLSRPTWSLDDVVWVVVDGNNVLRAIQEPASGQPARLPVDSVAVVEGSVDLVVVVVSAAVAPEGGSDGKDRATTG